MGVINKCKEFLDGEQASHPKPRRKMLNQPKKLIAVSTKELLRFCPPVCPLPHSYFKKQTG
jgi:hypothetical protein